MKPIKVACYSVFSESPEQEAISKIEYYAKENGIEGYRIFVYDIWKNVLNKSIIKIINLYKK